MTHSPIKKCISVGRYNNNLYLLITNKLDPLFLLTGSAVYCGYQVFQVMKVWSILSFNSLHVSLTIFTFLAVVTILLTHLMKKQLRCNLWMENWKVVWCYLKVCILCGLIKNNSDQE